MSFEMNRDPSWTRRMVLVVGFAFVVGMGTTAEAQFGNLFGAKAPAISLNELVELMNQKRAAEKQAADAGMMPPKSSFVLVDVRTDEEIKVSVIPGAITKAEYEKNRDQFKDQVVIPYCTIGGRSGRYASELQKAGVNVKNFQGSILEWVQSELPVVTLEGEPTKRVHIYSDRYKIPAKYEAVTK